MTGYEVLDTVMHELGADLRRYDSARANAAMERVETLCSSLGLWQVYH